MLKINDITKTFGSKKVLDGISLQVNTGEVAVLLGSSGVGKSTLLRVLNNLETAERGTIHFNDMTLDIPTLHQKHLVGMVFQQFNLFEHLTVERNITLGLEKVLGKTAAQAHEIATQLLTHYGLADKANAPISSLSGGQKQRLAIARTVAMRPAIICMDEPTSALDPLLTTHVANTIQGLAHEGYIVLVATHDTGLLDKLECTIYLMKDGKIIESAHNSAFKKQPEKYPEIARFVSGTIA